jgi:hypothetical protein
MIISHKQKSSVFAAALQRLAVDRDLAATLIDRLIIKSYTTQTDHAIFLVEPARFIVAPRSQKGYRIPLGADDRPLFAPLAPGDQERKYIGPARSEILIQDIQMVADLFAGLEGPRRRNTRREVEAAKRRKEESERIKTALLEFAGLEPHSLC